MIGLNAVDDGQSASMVGRERLNASGKERDQIGPIWDKCSGLRIMPLQKQRVYTGWDAVSQHFINSQMTSH